MGLNNPGSGFRGLGSCQYIRALKKRALKRGYIGLQENGGPHGKDKQDLSCFWFRGPKH